MEDLLVPVSQVQQEEAAVVAEQTEQREEEEEEGPRSVRAATFAT